MYADWETHAGVVRGIARRHLRPGVTHDELCTVGMAGLWRAATLYDPARGAAFPTYAAHRVNGEIADYIRVTFGRTGGHAATKSLSRATAPTTRDKGLAAVDARDEIDVRTREPVEHVRRGRDRLITWKGETMNLSGWADRLGMSEPTMCNRVNQWGARGALTRPIDTARRRA